MIIPQKSAIVKTSIEDSGLERYYSRNPLVRLVYLKKLDEALKLVQNQKFGSVLDLGCGNGILLPSLLTFSKKVFGIDLHTKLSIVKVKLGGDFLRGNISSIPIKDHNFDCVFCISVLEHLTNLSDSLLEMKRILVPEGTVVIGVPHDNCVVNFWFWLKKSPALKIHVNSLDVIVKNVEKYFEIEERKILRLGFLSFYTILKCVKKGENSV